MGRRVDAYSAPPSLTLLSIPHKWEGAARTQPVLYLASLFPAVDLFRPGPIYTPRELHAWPIHPS